MRRKNITSEMMKEYMAEALLILMEKQDFEDITIGEITKKAGVNRSTYYRNFESKGEIIKFYFTKIISDYLSSLDSLNSTKKIDKKEYLTGMFARFLQNKKQLLLIYHSRVSHYILDALNEMFITAESGNDFHERFPVYYHTGGIFNSFQYWFSEDMEASPEEMVDAVMRTMPPDFVPMLNYKNGDF